MDCHQEWRFRGHAEKPFWRWVCSWARALQKPSQLGFDDGPFVLPPLVEEEHVVKANKPRKGFLFSIPAVGLAEEREERRRTLTERCELVASLVNATGQPAAQPHAQRLGHRAGHVPGVQGDRHRARRVLPVLRPRARGQGREGRDGGAAVHVVLRGLREEGGGVSERSGIAWTDATMNPWWGCQKAGPECAHCYAERQATRYGSACFGNDNARRFFGDTHWNEPLKWARKASKEGRKWRVFCASMGDVFEDRPGLDEHRARLWSLIDLTANALDWLLLTKRPQNVRRMMPESTGRKCWMGTTVGVPQAYPRLDEILEVPAALHFVSCEPLLADLNIRPWLPRLQWVITGGESGPLFRECKREWVTSLRDQAASFGVPFFFKQWSGFRPEHLPPLDGVVHSALPEARP